MRKVKAEYAARHDGKFNIWRKIDILPDKGEEFTVEKHSLGDWILVEVIDTLQDASEVRKRIARA